jgi:hypothetical protein
VPRPRRRTWEDPYADDDAVLAAIRDRAAAGLPLAHSKAPPELARAARRAIGSWRAAIEAVGLDYGAIRLLRPAYTKAELLTELRALARRRPELQLADLHRKPYGGLAERVHAFFGSFEKAAIAAGVRGWPRRVRAARVLTRVEVIARIRARARTRRPVHAAAVARDARALYTSGRR